MKPRAGWLLCCLVALAGRVRAEPAKPEQVAHEYGAVATASRLARPVEPVPANVTVLTRDEIDANPTLTSDSLLRSVPSVMTFRRSSSLSADPSSQGLNLRGVAPSGVSRTLVLLDGVPVNDPFGGSIYYRALPRLGLSRIEIVPGGGSAMYGSAALSGVVQLFSRSTTERSFDADASYGLANTLALAARTAGGTRQLSASLEGDWLSSDGFHAVHERDRGPIDAPAATYHGTLRSRVDVLAHRQVKLSLGLAYFREELSGSTRFTSAAAELGTGSLQAEYDARARGRWNVLVFGRVAEFEQERARVAEGRVSEQRAARQFVPGYDQGGSLTWRSQAQQRGPDVLLGIDARHVSGS